MTKAQSVYLNFVRCVAALAVFFSHVGSEPFTRHLLRPFISTYGAVAVIMFFVLSGYVIGYVTKDRETDAEIYFSARISRMYSVVLVALLLTLILDTLGSAINPAYYAISKVMTKQPSVEGYLASLFFVNEYQVFGFNGIAPGSNGNYWSLSFEVTYYIVVGLFLFADRKISIPVSLLIFLLAGRTVLALFPIWVMGFLIVRTQDKISLRPWLALMLFVLSAGFLLMSPTIFNALPKDNFGFFFPWGRGPFNRNLLQDYGVALATGLHIFAASKLFAPVEFMNARIEKLFRFLGELTFPLYAIHFPLICFLAAISPWPDTSWLNFFFITLVCFLVVLLITPLTTTLKNLMKQRLLLFLANEMPPFAA